MSDKSDRWLGWSMLLALPICWYLIVLYQLIGAEGPLDPVPAALWAPAGMVVGISVAFMAFIWVFCCGATIALGSKRRILASVFVTVVLFLTFAPSLLFQALPWTTPSSALDVMAGIYVACLWVGVGIGLVKEPKKKNVEQVQEETYEEYEKYR